MITTISVVIVVVLLMIVVQSCDSHARKVAKIEKYIAAREYDEARALANEALDGWGDDLPITINRINTAQISTLLDNSGLDDAEAMAQELDAMPVLLDLTSKKLSHLYDKDFRSLYSFLARFPFHATFKDELLDVSPSDISFAEDYAANPFTRSNDLQKKYYFRTNVGYNDEVSKSNTLITQALNLAIFDKDIDRINKLFPLLKPIAKEIKRVKTQDGSAPCYDDYTITYKLENEAKAEALRKIKEAGINL